jgi:serine/threonine protein kinase
VVDPQTPASGASDHGTGESLGPYQLLERLGAGGLGEVFRARDTVHGRTVTVKRVPSAIAADALRAASLRETAQTLGAVSHPGVAALYECGEQDGELYLAQEFVPGQRLSELVGGRPLNPRRAVEIGIDVAEALAALHAAALMHGDLRPDNIVITPKGHAKLIDSGLGAFTAGGALRASAGARFGTLSTATLATVRYLSPEQAIGERVDARSDVFALGAVLYEMLTGQPAFDAATADTVIVGILQASPAAPSTLVASVPSELDLIVARALAKSLDRRYPSAAAIADDLRAAKTVLDMDLAQTTTSVSEPEHRQRPVALIVGGVLLLLASLAWWQRATLAALF